MFDIKEYYLNSGRGELNSGFTDIENDISDEIDRLVKNRFDSLYLTDRYRHDGHSIDIIHPKLSYPGTQGFLLSNDRVRFLLSFYPYKADLRNVNKIVIKPSFIEIGSIELVSLFLRKKKILVIYLHHPHDYQLTDERFDSYAEFVSMDLDKIINGKLLGNAVKKNEEGIKAHPLWYIMSLVSGAEDDSMDKFFYKVGDIDATYRTLSEISYFYSQHGY